MAKHRPNHR